MASSSPDFQLQPLYSCYFLKLSSVHSFIRDTARIGVFRSVDQAIQFYLSQLIVEESCDSSSAINSLQQLFDYNGICPLDLKLGLDKYGRGIEVLYTPEHPLEWLRKNLWYVKVDVYEDLKEE
jgi:hypothetical protein